MNKVKLSLENRVDFLFYFNWFLDAEAAPVVIQNIEDKLNAGKKVAVLSCDGALETCWKNPLGSSKTCARCRFWKRGAIRRFEGRLEHWTVDHALIGKEKIFQTVLSQVQYDSIDDIKRIYYNGAWYGWGAFSTYVSLARQSQPQITPEFNRIFSPLLAQGLRLSIAIEAVLLANDIGEIIVFNGRTADTRPVFDIAKAKDIRVRSLELARGTNGRFRGQQRVNSLPQDVVAASKEIDALWRNSAESDSVKCAVAKSFFEGRRAGKGTADVTSWVTRQSPQELPASWTRARRNIVFYTSSEFEVAGIKELQDGAAFESQIQAIDAIANGVTQTRDAHLTVRVHPNSVSGDNFLERKLKELAARHSRVSIEGAGSSVSTYRLMEESDLVVSANSTMAIEAAYWGKPAVITGRAFYESLGSTYQIGTEEELTNFIACPPPPLQKSGCIKYAYWLMKVDARTERLAFKTRTFNIMSKSVTLYFDAYRLCRSRALFRVADLLLFRAEARRNLVGIASRFQVHLRSKIKLDS